jgi:hypothetical protein
VNDESDDAAILARRQRFIALALSSAALATAACRPQPCLSVAAPEDTAAPPEQPEQPAEPAETPEQPEQPEAPSDATAPATPQR